MAKGLRHGAWIALLAPLLLPGPVGSLAANALDRPDAVGPVASLAVNVNAPPLAVPERPREVLTAAQEALLLKGLEGLQGNRLEEALEDFARLTREMPDFRLAQLIYGDLLMARAGNLRGFGNTPTVSDANLADLLDEARTRLRHQQHPPPPGTLPAPLLLTSPRQQHAIVVDLDSSRLYLFRTDGEGMPTLRADYYVSSGKNGGDKHREGDKRTPLGLYFITGQVGPERLPDFYGTGALPLNYPNEWDRVLKKTGYGIWLHGTPVDTYSRPPRASDGCVALTNPDFSALLKMAPAGTPVMIGRSLPWLEPHAWQSRRETFHALLDGWRQAWRGGDAERLLAYYSPDFHNRRQDYAAWSREARQRLAAHHGAAAITTLEDLSILGHPGPQEMVVVTFRAHHGGGEETSRPLRQYWRQEGGAWKIVYQDEVNDAAGG